MDYTQNLLKMERLYHKDHALINYHSDREIMTLHLIHQVSFTDYKLVFNVLLKKIKDKKVNAVIIDQRYAEDLNIEERAWLVTHWFPRLEQEIEINNFKMAVISSKNIFEKLGGDYIVNALQSKSKLAIIHVNSMDHALNWLNA